MSTEREKFINPRKNELESLLAAYLRLNLDGMAGINKRGNSQIISYYSGVTAENPSGNKNIMSIQYTDNRGTLYTETFTYDSDDDIIQIDVT